MHLAKENRIMRYTLLLGFYSRSCEQIFKILWLRSASNNKKIFSATTETYQGFAVDLSLVLQKKSGHVHVTAVGSNVQRCEFILKEEMLKS